MKAQPYLRFLLLLLLTLALPAGSEGQPTHWYRPLGAEALSPAFLTDHNVSVWTRQGRLWIYSLQGDLLQALHLAPRGGAGAAWAGGEKALWLLGRQKALLKVQIPSGSLLARLPLEDTYRTAPLVCPQGLFLVSENGRAQMCASDGQELWRKTLEGSGFVSPVLLPGPQPLILLPLRKGTLLALDPRTGDTRWSAQTRGVLYAPPAINPTARTIHQPGMDHTLYTFSPTGALLWTWKGTRWLRSTPALFADGTLALGSYDQKIHLISPQGQSLRSLTCQAAVNATPLALSDGRLISADSSGVLRCWSPAGTPLWTLPLPERDFFRTPLSLSPDQEWGAALRLDGLLILFQTGLQEERTAPGSPRG